MSSSLHQRVDDLRARIDALRSGQVRPSGFWDRALGRIGVLDEPIALTRILELDRELDRVGVHTVADARLLKSLRLERGRAAALERGLSARAGEVVAELEEAIRRAERAFHGGRLPPGFLTDLERAWPRVLRVLKVADVFSAPESAAVPDDGAFEILDVPSAGALGPPASARVAVAAFWESRARRNVVDVVQRRRDLDAAHELLLRVGSEFDRDVVRALRMRVSDARQRVRDAPPVRSLTELIRSVRRGAGGGSGSAYPSLRALYERAVEANDAQLARLAWGALDPWRENREQLAEALERAEPMAQAGPVDAAEDRLTSLALDLDEKGLEQFELAAGCARFFDVEDTLAERIVTEDASRTRPQPRRVPYPTEHLEFAIAGGLHEVRDFVIGDPRTLLYDLAANRQLVRAYVEHSPPPEPKRIRRTSVRVYVCDASGSMHGARARFRDAILLAELENIRQKARKGEPFDPLYFSFFTDTPTELLRVDSGAGAVRQIERILAASPADGQTDITFALMAAFDSIRAAQGRDPYLARATVVLVTDGEDRVDLEVIRRSRAPIDALEISLSFIALGEENRDLRSLVREQRQAGGRAFYVHLSDREILLARSEFDSRRRTLLPPELPVGPVALERLLPHLEALEQFAAGHAPVVRTAPEGSFDALFPEVPASSTQVQRTPGLLRVIDILDAIGEAASMAPAEERAAEAVVLLEHLLGVYGHSVPQYLESLAEGDAEVAHLLGRLRMLCGPFS